MKILTTLLLFLFCIYSRAQTLEAGIRYEQSAIRLEPNAHVPFQWTPFGTNDRWNHARSFGLTAGFSFRLFRPGLDLYYRKADIRFAAESTQQIGSHSGPSYFMVYRYYYQAVLQLAGLRFHADFRLFPSTRRLIFYLGPVVVYEQLVKAVTKTDIEYSTYVNPINPAYNSTQAFQPGNDFTFPRKRLLRSGIQASMQISLAKTIALGINASFETGGLPGILFHNEKCYHTNYFAGVELIYRFARSPAE